MTHWKRWITAVCLPVVAIMGACGPRSEPPVAMPISERWESAPDIPGPSSDAARFQTDGSSPATQPGMGILQGRVTGGPAIATVNGKAISRAELVNALLDSHGLQILEQLILLNATRQYGSELGLQVQESDRDAAHEEALQRLATPIANPDAPKMSSAEAQQLLAKFLAAKNISPLEWKYRMEQRAWLRKIAEKEVKRISIKEADLQREYQMVYGPKVQIRHIQVSSLAEASRVRALLLSGEDFELIARQRSENEFTAARGGLTRPFTRQDPDVTPALREAAFSLETGKLSETIKDGGVYHILRVERVFPASDVTFDNVNQEDLRQRLVDRLVRQREQELEAELFQTAKVRIFDKELDRQFRQKQRDMNTR